MGVTPYQEVTGVQTVSIVNIRSGGVSLTNNQPLLLEVPEDTYFTFVAYLANNTFYFVKFNESFDSSVDLNTQGMAFVRLLDVAAGYSFLNLVGSGNPNAATLFEYIGQWQQTSYKQVDTRFSSLLITPSMTSDSYSVPTTFEAGKAYTIVFFNNVSGYSWIQTLDRTIQASSSSSTSTSTSGSTPEVPSTSTSSTSGVIINNEQNSSSAKASVVIAVAAIAILASF